MGSCRGSRKAANAKSRSSQQGKLQRKRLNLTATCPISRLHMDGCYAAGSDDYNVANKLILSNAAVAQAAQPARYSCNGRHLTRQQQQRPVSSRPAAYVQYSRAYIH